MMKDQQNDFMIHNITFDNDNDNEKEENKSDDSRDFWEDCNKNEYKDEKRALRTISNISRNQKISVSQPKNNGLSHKISNGGKSSNRKTENIILDYKIKLKTMETIDSKKIKEIIKTGKCTERDKSFDKISNGKTQKKLEIDRDISFDGIKKKTVIVKDRIHELYLHSNQRKEKLNFLKEEKAYAQSEKEMKECTFQPQVNKKKKFVNDNSDFLNRNNKWMSDTNNKIEKIKSKVEEIPSYNFQPAINKKALNFNNKILSEDRNNIKYFQRINNAKKQKDELNKKLNPDFNLIYDKMFKKIDQNDEYATFNPNKIKNIDINSAKMTLHNELNSLTIE